MANEKFYCKVSKNGMLQFYDLEAFQNYCKANMNQKFFISFERLADENSIQSLFQLYTWWIDLIAKELYETKEEVDDTLSYLFLTEQRWSKTLDKPITAFKNKADMSYSDWIMFLRKIVTLAREKLNFVDDKGNVRLPIPENLKGKL